MRGGAFLKGKEGRVGFRKTPSLMVKKDGMILDPSLWQRETEGFEKNNYFTKNKILFPFKNS